MLPHSPLDINTSLNLVIIGAGNGLLPVWHQAITWTNVDLLSTWSNRTNFWENHILPKLNLNSNLVRFNLPITYFSIAQSFWNFAQNMAVTLPCSVQNFEMIGQLKLMVWTEEISWDLSSRWVSEGRISYIATSPWVLHPSSSCWLDLIISCYNQQNIYYSWLPC